MLVFIGKIWGRGGKKKKKKKAFDEAFVAALPLLYPHIFSFDLHTFIYI